ncbi:5'-3' exonuclease PLD3-like isoform X3 [Rhodnius prolixus]|uniref:5'-3' exonuclease PLD3-like isoform X3 n=1 Tax=Rhodnius prolixus TaxID=13249 RepID=UPI003D18E0E4
MSRRWGQKGWFKPSCVPITIILLLIVLVVLLPLLDAAEKHQRTSALNSTLNKCQQSCNFTLVETIPFGMTYKNGSTPYPSTYSIWTEMIASANHSLELASFYWNLRDVDADAFPGTEKGEAVFQALLTAGIERKIKVKIAQSLPTKGFPDHDTEMLRRKGAAEVRNVNMPRLVGGGILHTKLWIADRKSAYIGSANTDWRSLSQVKELGLFISNCTCLLQDIAKIFDVYWDVADPVGKIPDKWPDSVKTDFNHHTPLNLLLNNTKARVYVSSSPPQLCPDGRTSDIDSILSVIHNADKFVYISVMDYIPILEFTAKSEFWPVIDNALKSAAIDRKVELRLLISFWNYTNPAQKYFLKSLSDLSGLFKGVSLSVKFFVVPSTAAQRKISHARVNHNKYMVTDNTAYIGTSNWVGDYFTKTGGVGIITAGNTTLRAQLENIFLRDWNSEFSYPILLP